MSLLPHPPPGRPDPRLYIPPRWSGKPGGAGWRQNGQGFVWKLRAKTSNRSHFWAQKFTNSLLSSNMWVLRISLASKFSLESNLPWDGKIGKSKQRSFRSCKQTWKPMIFLAPLGWILCYIHHKQTSKQRNPQEAGEALGLCCWSLQV